MLHKILEGIELTRITLEILQERAYLAKLWAQKLESLWTKLNRQALKLVKRDLPKLLDLPVAGC